jgi:16S rRNA processing protein RimM
MAAAARNRVVVARFGAPHGVRGEIRLKAFTADPSAVAVYGPLDTADGRQFSIEPVRLIGPDMLVVRVSGVSDRTAAEALNGLALSLPRHRLPAPQEADDFYHADLIGLEAVGSDGSRLGTVSAVYNHGAGDILEIEREGEAPLLVPFTKEAVPVVDVAMGQLTVTPPPDAAGVEDEP